MRHPGGWVNGTDRFTCRGLKTGTAEFQHGAVDDVFVTDIAVHSLLGRVKQPRGFGSQHFATVSVTGLNDRGTQASVLQNVNESSRL